MSKLKKINVAVVGCGKSKEGAGGHSIGYIHAQAYEKVGYDIVGACDLNAENLERFAQEYDVPHADVDLATMLAAAKPEMVSICTYAGSHLQILEKCVEAGVKAVFMEKPLCLTKADAIRMQELAEAHDVKIVVNHFRRYLPRFREAKELLDQGVIGEPIFYFAGIDNWDLMEWGTHWLDMFRFFAGDQDVEWVLGQAEVTDKKGYGHVMEDHAICYCGFADGSKAILDGGQDFKGNIAIRIVGTEGIMLIPDSDPASYTNATGRVEFSEGKNIHWDKEEDGWAILHEKFAAWRDGGKEPMCSLNNALKSTELYLAAYESAARGGRINPPLDASQTDFPLNALIKQKT